MRKLLWARKELGLTQHQLGQRCGVREQVILYHENSESPVRSNGRVTLTIICAALKNEARAQRRRPLAAFDKEQLCPDVWPTGGKP